MKSKTIILALIAAVAVIAAGILVTRHENVAAPQLTRVTVAQVGEFFLYMPIYIAQQKNFFRDEGLDVNIVNTGGDEKSVAAVINGDADFGVGDPTFAAIAGLKGQDVRVVASVVNGVPFWGVAKNPRVPAITDPSKLSGFSVATFPAPSTAYTLQSQMFRDGGLEPNIRQAQFGTLLPLLDSGQVDIVLELEPNVSTAIAHGARVVFSMAQKYGDFAITGVTVSKRTLDNRRDLVQRFVRALNRADVFAHTNRDEALAIAQSRFPTIDPKIVAAALNRILNSNTYPRNAYISQDAWRKALSLRVSAGEIPNVESGLRFLDNSVAAELHE